MFLPFYNRNYNKPYSRIEDKYVYEDAVVNIVSGIPRFENSGYYATLFGDQWKQYQKAQLNSYSDSPITQTRLNRFLNRLKDDLKDYYFWKLVLVQVALPRSRRKNEPG